MSEEGNEGGVRARWAQIADRLLADIAEGRPPWVRPWSLSGKSAALPVSGSSGKSYRGVNVFLLWLASRDHGWFDARFYTFQQALKAGTPVRKGEKGTEVFFYSPMVKLPKPMAGKLWWSQGHPKLKAAYPDRLPDDTEVVPMLKSFSVFNAAQLEGMAVDTEPVAVDERCAAAERLASTLAVSVPVRIGGDRAAYSSMADAIVMPERTQFVSDDDWYSTLFHECCHASGHVSRLGRPLGNVFGSEEYAFEELIAESGSAFVLASVGLPYQAQHADYLASWAKKFAELPAAERQRKLMSAFTAGQKAADCVLAGLPSRPDAGTNAVGVELDLAA
ncbi:MAG: zincin-like metallopeptidase domain-containing protein [Sinobacteraceae bacterium]|nr:zincin-like metallopeptidase domain-containing protein [Nevskiaceae bacterium]